MSYPKITAAAQAGAVQLAINTGHGTFVVTVEVDAAAEAAGDIVRAAADAEAWTERVMASIKKGA